MDPITGLGTLTRTLTRAKSLTQAPTWLRTKEIERTREDQKPPSRPSLAVLALISQSLPRSLARSTLANQSQEIRRSTLHNSVVLHTTVGRVS